MTNEELLNAITHQIGGLRKEVNERLDGIEERLDGIEERLDGIEERLDGIEERVDGLEEDGAITRDGVNALLDWADIIGRINKHPIAK